MKIFLFTPLDYKNGHHPTHWNRNNGLLARELFRTGHEVRYVSYGVAASDVGDGVSLEARHEDLISTQWWRQHAPDSCLLGGGLDRSLLPVYDAARSAGVKTIMCFDSGALIAPRFHRACRDFWYGAGTQYLDAHVRFAWLKRLAKFVYYHASWRRPVSRYAAFFFRSDYIRVVTPVAQARLARTFFTVNRPEFARRLALIPHPVRHEGAAEPLSCSDRKKRIVAVGRWDAYAKNAPLLTRVLETVLKLRPDYTAAVVGPGYALDRHRRPAAAADVHRRIRVEGFMEHDPLLQLLAASQVFLISSRSESYNIAAAEALCMGCSVVAPAHIPSAAWFCGSDCGTISSHYASPALSDAVLTEIEHWHSGRRNPPAIAEQWRSRVGVENCALALVSLGSRVSS